MGSKPLMQQYPSLYNIVRRRNQTVASALGSIPLNISFRRALVGDKLGLWHELVSKVMNIVLTDANDSFKWTLTQNSVFTVKSMYRDLMLTNSIPCNSRVWKIKVPLKIKIFLWYLQKGVILTKDNLLKRRWKGESKCCFCPKDETIQHLFFECHVAKFVWSAIFFAFGVKAPTNAINMLCSWPSGFPMKLRKQVLVGVAAMCWAIWLSRNDVVFNRKHPNSYMQVIFRGAHWARSWSQLSKEEEKVCMMNNCRGIEGLVMELFAKRGWNFRRRLTH